ncbi:hypothetical protein [Nitrosococcus oceani]|uniref:Uncharacterized protein n=1 Tax=Nitrosococcus oceani C-27 TaxID=314279 RepID=A0A0E2YXB8_9GAMM|nr:hypothetical protein [Nitrosococcus oceani]KFI18103.1 hypothetical protein IB75_15510 [Nitrosococcus oceani C-27]
MTDVDFVPTKPHQPGEFALQWVSWAGHDLALKALGWVSPSTRITSPPTVRLNLLFFLKISVFAAP